MVAVRLVAAMAATTLSACAPQQQPTDTIRPEVLERVPARWAQPLDAAPAVGARGAISADEPLAAAVGLEILRRGGNAVDAAVATAFALAASFPEAGNIGGGGFMLLRTADGQAHALDFRETAPAASTRDMYLDAAGELTTRSVTGHLASGVPGSVAGLWAAHERFGSMEWAALIEPAIRLAEDGFTVDSIFNDGIASNAGRLRRFAESRRLFLPGGRPLPVGSTWRNPDLAATLRRIAEQGPAGFYEGETADLIVAEMLRGGGIITRQDLAGYRAVWREPVSFEYRGHRIVSMPPPSSGGLTLAIAANILEPYDLGALGWSTPESLHLNAEAMRRAFADRNHYLGDPDFVDIPRERLKSPEHAGRLRETISTDRATPSELVGPEALVGAAAGGDHTTHMSVVDAEGNAVALTTTINSLFGSAVTVTGAGFVLNNEMDDFTAKPGEPNIYGLVQGEANAIEPGKRMLSAMTPTVVVGPAGRPLMVTGARGGPRIISAVWQTISNLIDHRLGVAATVSLPRVHHQHLPDVLFYEENGMTAATIRALEALGHQVRERSGYIGVAPTIIRTDAGWAAMRDGRRGGAALAH